MQRRQFQNLALAGAVLLLAGVTAPVQAQDQDDMQRGVARISVMDGQVSVRRGDAGEWVAGVINAPLMADDSISTAPNSRGEVQFDAANLMRIGGNAEVHLTALENDRYQMELAHGTITFRVLRASSANVEVDTPNISVRPSKIGIYRISVNDSGETELTVRAGDVEVFTPKGSRWVNAGQTMHARGNASDPEFQIAAAISGDDWDRWSDARDQILMQASSSYQYVPQGEYGVEDLQNYGTWTDTPDYGYVWRPTAVDAGWSPYSAGRWVWEDWYGWTWVSSDPWGWAPYHYGRWYHAANLGWCWYPGALHVRHYWSPALVAFFGWGGGGGFGFGFGNVGWVPLAPFEVFHPWWGRGFYGSGFSNRVNITNINIYNNYRNARVLHGVSGVSGENFRSGRFGGNIVHASGEQIHSAGLIRGQMPVGPSNANLRYSEHANSFAPRNNNAGGPRNFFQHQQPGAVQHMAVTQELRRGGQEGRDGVGVGRTGGGVQFGSGRNAEGSMRQGETGGARNGQGVAVRPSQNGASGGGWGRFGTPSGQQAGRSNVERQQPSAGFERGGQNSSVQNARPPQSPNSNGWRGFGQPSNGGHEFNGGTQTAPGGQRSGEGFNNGSRGNAQPNSRPEQMRIAPPVMHERQNSQGYSAPRETPNYRSAPSYSAPRSAPSYSAPRSAPSYSAPRPSGGGGGGGGVRSSGGGGGGHHR